MNTSRALVGVVAGIAVGSAAGFFIGRASRLASHAGSPPSSLQPVRPETPVPSTASAPAFTAGGVPPGRAESLEQRLDRIAALPSYMARFCEAERLFADMTLGELPGALAAIGQLRAPWARYPLISELFKRWGELDPQAALGALSDVPVRDRRSAKMAVFNGWAATDPDAVWEHVQANPPTGFAEQQIIGAVLAGMSKVDLRRALSETMNLADNSRRMMTASRIIMATAESGAMPQLIAELQRMEASTDRDNFIRDAFKQWSALDGEAPLAALNAMNDPALARSATTGMLSGWAESDPMGAVAYALERRDDPLVAEALGPVMQAAVENAEAAQVRSLVTSLRDAGLLQNVAETLVAPLSNQNPEIALELIPLLPNEQQRQSRTAMILSRWSRENFPAAAAYFEQMPAGPTRTQSFASLSREALLREGGAAMVARWVGSFPGADRTRAVIAVIGSASASRTRLDASDKALLARIVSETPGLPEPVRQQAEQAFGAPPSP